MTTPRRDQRKTNHSYLLKQGGSEWLRCGPKNYSPERGDLGPKVPEEKNIINQSRHQERTHHQEREGGKIKLSIHGKRPFVWRKKDGGPIGTLKRQD